jgi:uncharacterized protein (DUF2062 family)
VRSMAVTSLIKFWRHCAKRVKVNTPPAPSQRIDYKSCLVNQIFMREKIKKFLKQFFLINDSPHKVAAGAALGIFLGILPGEGVATTLILASLFGFNRLSATAGVLATNMWGTVVVLPAAAAVGGFFFGIKGQELIADFNQTYHLGFKYFLSKTVLLDIALPLVVGFIIIASIISLGFYFVLKYLLLNHKVEFKKFDE